MKTIRYVKKEDRSFWFCLDTHIGTVEFENKVILKRGYVILEDNIPIGILRYNLFWDTIPFCTMLHIKEEYQQKGYGKDLLNYWENEMKQLGYGMVMTSTQVDELAQHFYRKMGYQDSGSLLLNIPNYEQPMEMFFTKAI